MVWFAMDWAGHVAGSTAEISESLAQALVDAGVASVVEGRALDGLDGSDGLVVPAAVEAAAVVPAAAPTKRRAKR